MADRSAIEWTDATVNAVNGCTVLSPGCKGCYAMKQAHRVAFRRDLVTKTAGGMVWNGQVYLHEPALMQPLGWTRPRSIFWNAHGDLFHPAVPVEWIDRVFATIALSPQHIHQVLTKRAERMRHYMADPKVYARILDQVNKLRRAHPRRGWGDIGVGHPETWHQLWLGVSIEDQERADERVGWLLDTPAAVRFLSVEPMLGPINLTHCRDAANPGHTVSALTGWGGFDGPRPGPQSQLPKIRWVIVGGESGPRSRPMHPAWVRELREQCRQARVPFFFKQWGEWMPLPRTVFLDGPASVQSFKLDDRLYGPDRIFHFPDLQAMVRVGKKTAGRLLDKVQHDGMPA